MANLHETAIAPTHCPVCREPAPRPFIKVDGKDYWKCNACEARFLDPRQRLSREDERSHYLHHENDPDDLAYRQFLSKLAAPLLQKLTPAASGLDYGCGPGPALAAMLAQAGHPTALYDPYFHADRRSLDRSYDFIVCTETAEHFFHPAAEFDRFDRLLRPGGWLGVMTCFQTDDARFPDWRYRKDPTHVVFYRETTLRYIAAMRDWTCEIPVKDVALMHKQPLETR